MATIFAIQWVPMTLLLDETAVARRPAGVVRVTGTDRLSYLHTMLSQHLEAARPGDVADFAYLDPKGNPLAAGRAVVTDDAVLLVTPSPQVAADLAAALEKFKFLTQVEAADISDGWALASIRGPEDQPTGTMTAAREGDGWVVRDRRGGSDLLGPDPWVRERVAQLDLPEASDDDWESWRITHGVPAWGPEIAPGRRLQELGLLPTHVHLDKGCYPGQESIAKIYNLGAPRRALALVEAADELSVGGLVTSAVPVDGRWLALALLPLADGDLPATVDLDGVQARVVRRVGEELTPPGA
jgi:tRNA-modifying protein YgfZ